MKKGLYLQLLSLILITPSLIGTTGDMADEFLNAYVHQQQLNSEAKKHIWNNEILEGLLAQGAQLSCHDIRRKIRAEATQSTDITNYELIFDCFQQCMEQKPYLFNPASPKIFMQLFENGYIFNFKLWSHLTGALHSGRNKENKKILAAIGNKFKETWSLEEQEIYTKKMQKYTKQERNERANRCICKLIDNMDNEYQYYDVQEQEKHFSELASLLKKGANPTCCELFTKILADIVSKTNNEDVFSYFEHCMHDQNIRIFMIPNSITIAKKLKSRGFNFTFAQWKDTFSYTYCGSQKQISRAKRLASILETSHDTWSPEEQIHAKKIRADMHAYHTCCKILGIQYIDDVPAHANLQLDIDKLLAKLSSAFSNGAEVHSSILTRLLAAHPEVLQYENLKFRTEEAIHNDYDAIISSPEIDAETLLKAIEPLHGHGFAFTQEHLQKTVAWKDSYNQYLANYPYHYLKDRFATRLKNLENDMIAYQKIVTILAASVAHHLEIHEDSKPLTVTVIHCP